MKPVFFLLLAFSLQAAAQTAQTYISKGNEHYLKLDFVMAEAQYRQALNVTPQNAEAKYNLANALMQQKKYGEAAELYAAVTTAENKNLRAAAFYNQGVSYSKQKDLPNSIEAYKSALRINPTDKEARENLQKALTEQKKQEQQNKGGGGGGGMSQKEAEEKLKKLQQKERDLQKRLQNSAKGQGNGGSKDW